MAHALGLWLLIGSIAAAEPLPPPPALPSPMRMEDAVALLRERGLDLLIAEASVQSAQGDVGIAGAIPNPGLNGSYGLSFGCTSTDGSPSRCPPAFGVGLSDQNALFDSLTGKRGLRLDVARRALEAARQGRADAERSLVFQVKQQFEQVLLAADALKFARETQEASRQFLELTSVRYRTGAISEADLARVETAKLEADQAVSQAEQGLRAARVGLAFLLGVRTAVPEFEVEGEQFLHYLAIRPLDGASGPSLIQEALVSRPDLKAQQLQARRAEASLALAERLRVPDVGLSVGYSQQGTGPNAYTPPTFTFGVTTALPVFYQQQGEILKARADLRTQQLQLAKAEAQVINDVEGAWAAFIASRELAKRMEGGLLDRSRRALELVEIQYRKGAASLLDYLDARRTYVSVKLEYLQDVTNYWTSVFKLEQAVGKELR